MNRLLLLAFGYLLGILTYVAGDGYLVHSERGELHDIKLKHLAWLEAHLARDREDEKVRQDMHKILNRLALMGAPRHSGGNGQ